MKLFYDNNNHTTFLCAHCTNTEYRVYAAGQKEFQCRSLKMVFTLFFNIESYLLLVQGVIVVHYY